MTRTDPGHFFKRGGGRLIYVKYVSFPLLKGFFLLKNMNYKVKIV